jgi:hypothetical protein
MTLRKIDKELYARFVIDPRMPRDRRYAKAMHVVLDANVKEGTSDEYLHRFDEAMNRRAAETAGCKACRKGWRCFEHRHFNAAMEEFMLGELRLLDTRAA